MLTITADGSPLTNLLSEQEEAALDILSRPAVEPSLPHLEACNVLRIGAYKPSNACPFALQAVLVKFYLGHLVLIEAGGWRQCWSCGTKVLSGKTLQCHGCCKRQLRNVFPD